MEGFRHNTPACTWEVGELKIMRQNFAFLHHTEEGRERSLAQLAAIRDAADALAAAIAAAPAHTHDGTCGCGREAQS